MCIARPALLTVLVTTDIPVILMSDLIENRTTDISCSARYGASDPADLGELHRPTLHLFVDGREQDIVTELTPGRPPQDGATFQASVLSTVGICRLNYLLLLLLLFNYPNLAPLANTVPRFPTYVIFLNVH